MQYTIRLHTHLFRLAPKCTFSDVQAINSLIFSYIVLTQINHIQIGKRPRWYKKVPACFQHWWKSQNFLQYNFSPNQWNSFNHKNGSWLLVPDSDKWSSPFTYSAKTLQKAYLRAGVDLHLTTLISHSGKRLKNVTHLAVTVSGHLQRHCSGIPVRPADRQSNQQQPLK